MSLEIKIRMTPQGLLIPRAALGDWAAQELEAVRERQSIVIRPKPVSSSEQQQVLQALREDGLLVEIPQPPLQPPPTPEERAELARKLSLGRSLSEIVIEERASGW